MHDRNSWWRFAICDKTTLKLVTARLGPLTRIAFLIPVIGTGPVKSPISLTGEAAYTGYVWPAPGLDDTQLSKSGLPLELHRAQITDRRVSAFRVVEALDIVKHVSL